LPEGSEFGDVAQDVESSYAQGETVTAVFWSGHPNNDLRTQDSYLKVQIKQGAQWVTVANDWDWNTTFRWSRISEKEASSQAAVTWHIPADAQPGTYRIVHEGASKQNGRISAYSGVSSNFDVLPR